MSAAEALREQPAHIDPQAAYNTLRTWIVANCADPNPVRSAAYSMAMSATAHRLLKYGPDATLSSMTARDLMNLLMYLNGPLAEYIMRTAYFRAIIEGQHAIYEHMNTTLFIPECRAWYWTIVEAMLGKAPDPEQVTVWLENMTGEEKQTARLIIARVYPDTAHIDWLQDAVDTTQPPMARLMAELCIVLASKPTYVDLVKKYLREHPHVRYAVPEGTLP